MSSHEEMNGGSIPMHFRVNTEGISDEAQQAVVDSIRVVPNFPKPAFGSTIDALVHKYAGRGITGIECRGFCFAAPVAIALKVPFVPFRKPGKLPCKSIGIDFKQSAGKHSAYFGKDRLEMHEDALTAGSKVLIIDDLLGTGSTMFGACELVEKVGATVVECACIVEVKELAGRARVKRNIFILIEDAED